MSTQKGFIAWGSRVKGYDSSNVPVELTYWQQEKIREGNQEVQRAFPRTWELFAEDKKGTP